MGLDVSHGCWSGGYMGFMGWRRALAKAAGLPPLQLMDGFFRNELTSLLPPGNPIFDMMQRLEEQLPISWDILKPDPLHELLLHSDCEGTISWQKCAALADRLTELAPLLSDSKWSDATTCFAAGLRVAAAAREDVKFS